MIAWSIDLVARIGCARPAAGLRSHDSCARRICCRGPHETRSPPRSTSWRRPAQPVGACAAGSEQEPARRGPVPQKKKKPVKTNASVVYATWWLRAMTLAATQ